MGGRIVVNHNKGEKGVGGVSFAQIQSKFLKSKLFSKRTLYDGGVYLWKEEEEEENVWM